MIDEILKQLAQELNKRLLSGDYKVIQVKQYQNKIKVDDFVFQIWGETQYPEHGFSIHAGSILDSRFYDFMKNKTFQLSSNEDRLKAWKVWKKKEKEYMEVKGKRDKQKKINRLKKEIQELEAEQENIS